MTSRRIAGTLAVCLAGVLSAAVLVAEPAAARIDAPIGKTPHQVAAAAYQRMTPAQRVGQLFMAGVLSTGATAAQLSLIRDRAIGDVILDGNTMRSQKHVHHITRPLVSALSEAGVAPFVSTDQEGGEVQRLRGSGFSAIPTALQQGTVNPSTLKADAKSWGAQLLGAGVNLDLAPVADTVPAKHAKQNQPIGRFFREFGHTPSVVSPHVVAVVRGMKLAGVATTVKHFPGLGRATGNTDLSSHVTDPTTRHDPFLAPFKQGIAAGAQFVMVSSATYPHIDKTEPACFSAKILTVMLRGDLSFGGVVISDDLGTAALSHTPLGLRATRFFAAGGTMLLDTSINQLPSMVHAVRSKVRANPAFAATVHAAVMNVLLTKARAGLITP